MVIRADILRKNMITKLFNTGYVCGALIGNGNIQADSKNKRYSMFLESKNKEFVDLFGQRLDAFFETETNKYTRTKGKLILYSVVFYNKEQILEFTDKFRFNQGAHKWNVPKLCYEGKHFRRGFLQGYFDSKANIRIRYRKRQKKGNSLRFDKIRNIRVSSVNKKGLSEIKLLLETFGIGCTISQSNNNYILDIEGKRRLGMFSDKICFGISKKQQELERALERKSNL